MLIYACSLHTVSKIDLSLIFECLSDETGCGGQLKPKKSRQGHRELSHFLHLTIIMQAINLKRDSELQGCLIELYPG